MQANNDTLTVWLFRTNAVRVSPQDKPFWYTSGTIGPYYINTHFLYGSEEKANKLLALIDEVKSDKLACPQRILEQTEANYREDVIYRNVINIMLRFIRENIGEANIDCISGGERRDWFFSLLIAEILHKPHITIYKDLDTVLFENGVACPAECMEGKRVLHIADLITEASSYTRAWIPAVRRLGASLEWSLVVVDRLQGGAKNLEAEGVKSFALTFIDRKLFENALEQELISKKQYEMLEGYIENPHEAMRRFLLENPEFLSHALEADAKTRERARLLVEKDLYGLKG